MIVCSCHGITDADIEQALVEVLSRPDAPLPTPGVIYRQLAKKMVCCGCAPLAVSTIYEKIDQLCACAQGRLLRCASETPAQRLIDLPPVGRRTAVPPPSVKKVLEPV